MRKKINCDTRPLVRSCMHDRGRVLAWTALFLACCGVPSCSPPTLMVENSVVQSNRNTEIVGYVHRKPMFPFLQDVKGESVTFTVDRQDVGLAMTDDDGKAELAGGIPPSDETTVSARAKVGLHDLHASATAFHWRPDRVIIVVDIDNTIYHSDDIKAFIKTEEPKLRPIKDSRETLTRLAERYEILYVTARPRRLLEGTRKTLQDDGFPLGPVFTSAGVTANLQIVKSKRDNIMRVKKDWPNVLIGIGNRATDAEAYGECGMLAIIVRPEAEESHRSHAVFMPTWENIARFFEANNEELSNAAPLNSVIAGRTLLKLPVIALNDRAGEGEWNNQSSSLSSAQR